MKQEAASIFEAAQNLAESGDWTPAFVDLWKGFDLFTLLLLQERMGVGTTGSEMDRFALRRALVPFIPDGVEQQLLTASPSQHLLESMGASSPTLYRDLRTAEARDEILVALLDILYAIHLDVSHGSKLGGDGMEDICREAYQALLPLVEYLVQST